MFFRTNKPLSLAGKNLTSTYDSSQLTTAISLPAHHSHKLDTTSVDAAKTQLALIEFQKNAAVKEILFDGTPENFLSKEGISIYCLQLV